LDASGPKAGPSAAASASRLDAWSEIYDPGPGSLTGAAAGGPKGKGSPAAPVAPLGTQGQGRRQRREPKGRTKDIHLRLSESEWRAVAGRAEEGGVSVPRLLVELAILGPAGATERNTMRTALINARRQIAGVANNLNQLAHWANARQQLPPGFDKALADVVAMEAAVEELRLAIDKASRGQR
jgi:hypothetical protein